MGLWAVAVVVALTAALAGCTSDPQLPSTLPPLTSASAPTPSAEPAPSAISAPTPEGATEFARYFYAQVELAYARKDPGLVARLSAPDCETCAAFVDTLNDVREQGHRYEGVVYNIKFAEAPGLSGNQARVSIIYDGPEVRRYDASGKVIATEPAVVGLEEQLTVIRSGESWLVKAVDRP